MSSRLAPAIWSSFRGTRLEGLFGSGHLIGGRHAPPRWSSGCVRLLRAELRPVLPASGGRRRRGGGTMEIRDGGLTAQCSVSARGVGGGSAGGDQQLSSSSSPSSSSVLPSSPPASSAGTGAAIRFCSKCGGATEEKIPAGETVLRFVCCACGAVHYQNPKMVVGCLVEHEEKVLLCRRNCEPAYGLWTLPAGYLEIGESSAEGAARETLEEACADVQILGLFSLLDIPVIGQCVTVFRARLKNLHFAPGPESLECALFKLDEIPFEDLAFGSIHLTLKMYLEDIRAGQFKVHQAVIDKRPGASRSDLKAYVVRDVLTS